jgi:hypothetical protein
MPMKLFTGMMQLNSMLIGEKAKPAIGAKNQIDS